MLDIYGLHFFPYEKSLSEYLRNQSEIILDSDYNCPECESYYCAVYYFSGGTNSCKKCGHKNADLEIVLDKLKILNNLLLSIPIDIKDPNLTILINGLRQDIISERQFSKIIDNFDILINTLEYWKFKNS